MNVIDQEKYDNHKKSICDENGVYMPKHTHAVIISMLEQVLLNQNIILNKLNEVNTVNNIIQPIEGKKKKYPVPYEQS